ncbi:hypothetical protein [Methylotetracoccus oryzae]|uniref:hypothetical protein n=1 Tax=Methylotetracoccus oryzae TaxID=1919059 RepID=UPI0011192BD0|nr:hypothetical protein [Methylotetracoccus oryzae]
MLRVVTTHVGVTDQRTKAITAEIAALQKALERFADVIADTTSKQINPLFDLSQGLRNAVDSQARELAKAFQRIASLEARQATESIPLSAGQVKEPALQAIRVLAQVQDIVTDKDFKLKENNETLTKKISISSPYRESLERISDAALQAEYKGAFAPFLKGDHEERSERFVMIQKLNSRLIQFFADQSA